MAETPLPRLPMTKALKALIVEATGKPCEIRTIPRLPDGTAVEVPFTILHPLWSTYSGPAFYDVHEDVEWNYQASVAASRGDQIEVFHDKLVRAIVGRDGAGAYLHALTVEGMSVMSRNMGDENDGGSSDVDTKAGIITHDVRFSITVTPKG